MKEIISWRNQTIDISYFRDGFKQSEWKPNKRRSHRPRRCS